MILGCEGLQTAVANGDTRSISLHHLHTGEDLTITYKRDGRYDEDALTKINWELRDWRRGEATKMDPHVIDVVWEVNREVGGKQPIQIVCGYRAPETNAMLRRRSNGVAKFSQHMLGKAIDLYIPGVPLEAQREAGLRLQRGGVGFYPTSGSPFVHLDVGNVRHWPRMPADQLARVLRGAKPVQVASADDTHVGSSSRNILASLFGGGKDEEDDTETARLPAPSPRLQSASASPARPAKPAVVQTAAAQPAPAPKPEAKPETRPEPRRALGAIRPAEPAAPITLASAQNSLVRLSEIAPANPAPAEPPVSDLFAERGMWDNPADDRPVPPMPIPEPVVTASAGDAMLVNPSAPDLRTASVDRTGSIWPMRTDEADRVPPEVALAYAAQADAPGASAATPRTPPMGAVLDRARLTATEPAVPDDVRVVKKTLARLPAAREPAPVASAAPPRTVAPTVVAGMRFDDPWLRAILLAPSLQTALTTTVFGEPDFSQLRPLMEKPTATVVMTFSDTPYQGIATDRFSGGAVVFLSTVSFARTASLQ